MIDLKNNKDISIIKNMLKDADVFITNVRYKSLKKMGLTEIDIQKD